LNDDARKVLPACMLGGALQQGSWRFGFGFEFGVRSSVLKRFGDYELLNEIAPGRHGRGLSARQVS
jgi:hypothetical protein